MSCDSILHEQYGLFHNTIGVIVKQAKHNAQKHDHDVKYTSVLHANCNLNT